MQLLAANRYTRIARMHNMLGSSLMAGHSPWLAHFTNGSIPYLLKRLQQAGILLAPLQSTIEGSSYDRNLTHIP